MMTDDTKTLTAENGYTYNPDLSGIRIRSVFLTTALTVKEYNQLKEFNDMIDFTIDIAEREYASLFSLDLSMLELGDYMSDLLFFVNKSLKVVPDVEKPRWESLRIKMLKFTR